MSISDVTTTTRGARVRVSNLTKVYSGGVNALSNVSFEVEPGEFLALLGPSGSGKTTLLMSIAGFESPTDGEILIDNRDVVRVPVHKRNLGMMFQRYALFPHLDVRKNIEYPLKARGVRAKDRLRLAQDALKLVSLDGFERRRVSELSGGQQQRVALARAIVYSPSLLLMDEPLGALDQKLREQVQLEIRSLHRRIGSTIVFVTHDQQEAMTMADRVAVMDNACISQIGTPSELYEKPENRFVAGFVGEMNFLHVEIVRRTAAATTVRYHGLELTLPNDRVHERSSSEAAPTTASLAFRPQHIEVSDSGTANLSVRVKEVIFRGAQRIVLGTIFGDDLKCELNLTDARVAAIGDDMPIRIDINRAHLYVD